MSTFYTFGISLPLFASINQSAAETSRSPTANTMPVFVFNAKYRMLTMLPSFVHTVTYSSYHARIFIAVEFFSVNLDFLDYM